MPQRTVSQALNILAVLLVSATIAFAQSSAFPGTVAESHSWRYAQLLGASKRKLNVITLDQANRRHTCRVQSFTDDALICSRTIGNARIYHRKQIAAILLPGDDEMRLRLLLGLNAGLSVAIWGTVVLAVACPACAVGTGIAAFIFFAAAGAMSIGDDVPDRLLYLAPGQEPSKKRGYIQD